MQERGVCDDGRSCYCLSVLHCNGNETVESQIIPGIAVDAANQKFGVSETKGWRQLGRKSIVEISAIALTILFRSRAGDAVSVVRSLRSWLQAR
jgi:hypothetical protein